MTALSALFGLMAGVAFAFSGAAQHRAAHSERSFRATDPRLLLQLLRRPLWLLGSLADLVGLALQVLALRLGPLTVVQVVMVSALFLSVPLEAVMDGRRPRAHDLATVALGGAGLAAFLLAATPRAGISEPSGGAWATTAAWVLPLVALCLVGAVRTRGRLRTTLLGLATGVIYGLSAAMLKAVAGRLDDPVGVLTHWQLYALAVIGLAGLALNQNAFQHGSLSGSLTALTLPQPVVAGIIGVTAFRESLSTRTGSVALVVAGLALIAAIALVRGRSGVDHDPGREAPAEAERGPDRE